MSAWLTEMDCLCCLVVIFLTPAGRPESSSFSFSFSFFSFLADSSLFSFFDLREDFPLAGDPEGVCGGAGETRADEREMPDGSILGHSEFKSVRTA